jgi:hypothetical protein
MSISYGNIFEYGKIVNWNTIILWSMDHLRVVRFIDLDITYMEVRTKQGREKYYKVVAFGDKTYEFYVKNFVKEDTEIKWTYEEMTKT